MNMEGENAGAEIRRLRGCISDLLCVSAIQAISRRREPEDVVGVLLEVLVGTLHLNLAYAEFKLTSAEKPIALARTSQLPAPNDLAPEIRAAVEARMGDLAQESLSVVRCQSTGGDHSLAIVGLGLHAEIGWLLVCSRRDDFPTQTERLILGVAANQAVIGVQHAQLLSEQRRVAQELDRKVWQRTKELEAANAELSRALKQIDALRDAVQRENLVFREQAARNRGGLAPWQLRRAEALMSKNLGQRGAPLGQIAEACGLSARHFARAFRQSTGIPPHRWLLNRRVERAKELLSNSQLALSDIALACGFADQSHFTRIFSATVRLSPGHWRRVQLVSPTPALRSPTLNVAPDRTQRQPDFKAEKVIATRSIPLTIES